jgi:hypothetical protein
LDYFELICRDGEIVRVPFAIEHVIGESSSGQPTDWNPGRDCVERCSGVVCNRMAVRKCSAYLATDTARRRYRRSAWTSFQAGLFARIEATQVFVNV